MAATPTPITALANKVKALRGLYPQAYGVGVISLSHHVDNGVARGAGNDYSVPMTYRVVQTIQSITGSETPVEVEFYTGDNHAKAISALVSASVDNSDSEWYNVLSVRIDMEA